MKKLLFSISLALSLAACNEVSTVSPITHNQQVKAAAAAWATGVTYKVGDIVTYNARDYKCLQPHTSLAGWEPANVASLWQDLGATTGGDTTQPTASLSASSTSVTANGSVTFTATASDNVGVTKVEFYDGATLLATKTAAPYTNSISYTSANNGTKSYTVKAFDAAGNVTTSAAVSVVVNIPVVTTPSVTLTSSSTSVTTASTLTLTATPSNVTPSKVEFYSGTTLIATKTAAPYTHALALTSANNGAKTFTAKVYSGTSTTAVATSAAVNVNVNISTTTTPSVTLTSSSTSVTTASTLTLTATPSNVTPSKVEFYSGTTLIKTVTAAPYTHALALTSANNGAKTFTAKVYSGTSTTAVATSNAVNVNVAIGVADTTAPTASLAASSTNVTAAGSVTFTATATDNVGVSKVEFYEGATLIATDTTAPYTNSISYTSANNGTKSYTVKAFDAAGNVATSSVVSVNVNIISDAVAPTVSLASSSTNVTAAGAITLTANASDNVGVSKVEFYRGTTLLGTANAAPYTAGINLTSADNGTLSLTAKAFDAAGNVATSSAVSVVVNIPVTNTDPCAVAPAAGAPSKPILRLQKVWDTGDGRYFDVFWSLWSGAAPTSWQLVENNKSVYTGSASAVGEYNYRVTNKIYGTYSYRVAVSNAQGTICSDPVVYSVDGASTITIAGEDKQALQITLPIGQTSLDLKTLGANTEAYSVLTNNTSVLSATVAGSKLNINALKSGRASLKLVNTTTNAIRFLGVRVRKADGSLPDMPDYVSVGSVSEDTSADLNFWQDFQTDNRNKRMDVRYIYINGGTGSNNWRKWTSIDGYRATSFVRESLKLGMIPYFVWYNIPDSAEDYAIDRAHINDNTYMTNYFKDLKFFLDILVREAGDETVGIILEPDFLGYMMQQANSAPDQISAVTNTAYSSGVLDAKTDPTFSNDVKGLVQAINYTIRKYAPRVKFGWQFNTWAYSQNVPGTGLMHATDTMGFDAGRQLIQTAAMETAKYYLSAGITDYGASFISIDKYGLDGGYEGGDPSKAKWLWSADHWNNYLGYVKTLSEQSKVPAILWQLPVGHLNESQTPNPYAGGAKFPILDNSVTRYEDSAPTFFLGDSFKPGAGIRFDTFKNNLHADPKISVSGDTITWGEHMTEAKNSHIISVLFGAGVGASTDGVGSPPTDGNWWITKVQDYFKNPVLLP